MGHVWHSGAPITPPHHCAPSQLSPPDTPSQVQSMSSPVQSAPSQSLRGASGRATLRVLGGSVGPSSARAQPELSPSSARAQLAGDLGRRPGDPARGGETELSVLLTTPSTSIPQPWYDGRTFTFSAFVHVRPFHASQVDALLLNSSEPTNCMQRLSLTPKVVYWQASGTGRGVRLSVDMASEQAGDGRPVARQCGGACAQSKRFPPRERQATGDALLSSQVPSPSLPLAPLIARARARSVPGRSPSPSHRPPRRRR